MACCLAIALVFGTLRRLPGLRGRGGGELSHAPMATRPAPGEAATSVAGPTRTAPVRRHRVAARPSGLLLGAALGMVLYTVVVAALFATGVAESMATRVLGRVTISGSLLLVAVAALVAAAMRHRDSLRAGRIAIGIGSAVELLSLLDMHLLSPFELSGGDPLVDVAFHATGPLIAVAGALLEVRAVRGPAPVAIGAAR